MTRKKTPCKKTKKPLTRTHILARDYAHASTDQLNREIVDRSTIASRSRDDAARLRFELSATLKRQRIAEQEAAALECVIEARDRVNCD